MTAFFARAAVALALTAAFGAQATALSISTSRSFDSNTIDLTKPTWTEALTFEQFNPSQGTLQSVDIALTGDLFANIFLESTNNQAKQMTATVTGTLALSRMAANGLAGSSLLVVKPVIAQVANLAAKDGVVDFAGKSGASFTELLQSATATVHLASDADLALFIGQGTLSTLLKGTAKSVVTGGGNLVSEFSTKVGGHATVTYNFLAAAPSPTLVAVSNVPEPESWALMLGGVGMLGFLARRRRAD